MKLLEFKSLGANVYIRADSILMFKRSIVWKNGANMHSDEVTDIYTACNHGCITVDHSIAEVKKMVEADFNI